MEQWQDAASRQAELLTNRLNGALSKGLELLRSELGVDLGLKPELIPPWLLLLAACSGMLLMLLLWASVCRGLFGKRPPLSTVDDRGEVVRGVSKAAKAEEPRKKRKKSEKKAQPNGRAVPEAQEEAIVSEESVPHQQPPPAEVKAEKAAETKKSKKKAKQAAKETKPVSGDGKEPEEGTWETKVSNKEKREQRKKDKNSSDGSASPGGGNTPVNNPPEPPKESAPPAPATQKKKKGEAKEKAKVEKVEAPIPQAPSREVAPVTAAPAPAPAPVPTPAAAPAQSIKTPALNVSTKPGTWTASREPMSLWRSEIDESWTVIDRGLPSSDMSLSFTGLGVSPAEPHPVSELPWLSQTRVDDEWSGINTGSVDPSSDWNAPSEAWGNYEEPNHKPAPVQEEPLAEPIKDKDEEEKNKTDAASDGVSKAKKKKKKKKNAEENGAVGQAEEPEKEEAPVTSVKKKKQQQQQAAPPQENVAVVQPVKTAVTEVKTERPPKENTASKPSHTQVPQKPMDKDVAAKQNSLTAAVEQKKPEESQAPKPAKKKKARRET